MDQLQGLHNVSPLGKKRKHKIANMKEEFQPENTYEPLDQNELEASDVDIIPSSQVVKEQKKLKKRKLSDSSNNDSASPKKKKSKDDSQETYCPDISDIAFVHPSTLTSNKKKTKHQNNNPFFSSTQFSETDSLNNEFSNSGGFNEILKKKKKKTHTEQAIASEEEISSWNDDANIVDNSENHSSSGKKKKKKNRPNGDLLNESVSTEDSNFNENLNELNSQHENVEILNEVNAQPENFEIRKKKPRKKSGLISQIESSFGSIKMDDLLRIPFTDPKDNVSRNLDDNVAYLGASIHGSDSSSPQANSSFRKKKKHQNGNAQNSEPEIIDYDEPFMSPISKKMKKSKKSRVEDNENSEVEEILSSEQKKESQKFVEVPETPEKNEKSACSEVIFRGEVESVDLFRNTPKQTGKRDSNPVVLKGSQNRDVISPSRDYEDLFSNCFAQEICVSPSSSENGSVGKSNNSSFKVASKTSTKTTYQNENNDLVDENADSATPKKRAQKSDVNADHSLSVEKNPDISVKKKLKKAKYTVHSGNNNDEATPLESKKLKKNKLGNNQSLSLENISNEENCKSSDSRAKGKNHVEEENDDLASPRKSKKSKKIKDRSVQNSSSEQNLNTSVEKTPKSSENAAENKQHHQKDDAGAKSKKSKKNKLNSNLSLEKSVKKKKSSEGHKKKLSSLSAKLTAQEQVHTTLRSDDSMSECGSLSASDGSISSFFKSLPKTPPRRPSDGSSLSSTNSDATPKQTSKNQDSSKNSKHEDFSSSSDECDKFEDADDILTSISVKFRTVAQRLKDFEVLANFSAHKEHLIEESVSYSRIQKKVQNILMGYGMKSDGRFSPKEDKIIINNWNKFCEIYKLDKEQDLLLFVKPYNGAAKRQKTLKTLSDDNLLIFTRFLGQGLPKRRLHSIYHRFNVLFHPYWKSKGSFLAEEDEFMLKHRGDESKYSFEELGLIFNRQPNSVFTRYARLSNRDWIKNCNVGRVKNNRVELEGQIRLIMKYTECKTISELKSFDQSKIPWVQINKANKYKGHLARKLWYHHLYTALHIKEPVSLRMIEYLIIKRLRKMKKVKSLMEVDWMQMTTYVTDFHPVHLAHLYHNLIRYGREKNIKFDNLSWHDKLDELYKITSERLSICGYLNPLKIHEDGTLAYGIDEIEANEGPEEKNMPHESETDEDPAGENMPHENETDEHLLSSDN